MKPIKHAPISHRPAHRLEDTQPVMAEGRIERSSSLSASNGSPRAHCRDIMVGDWKAQGVTDTQRAARQRLAELLDLPMNAVNHGLGCRPVPLNQLSPSMREITEEALRAQEMLLGTAEQPGPMRYVLDAQIEPESSDDEEHEGDLECPPSMADVLAKLALQDAQK